MVRDVRHSLAWIQILLEAKKLRRLLFFFLSIYVSVMWPGALTNDQLRRLTVNGYLFQANRMEASSFP